MKRTKNKSLTLSMSGTNIFQESADNIRDAKKNPQISSDLYQERSQMVAPLTRTFVVRVASTYNYQEQSQMVALLTSTDVIRAVSSEFYQERSQMVGFLTSTDVIKVESSDN